MKNKKLKCILGVILTILVILFGKVYSEFKLKIEGYEEHIQNSISNSIVYLLSNEVKLESEEKDEISGSIRRNIGILKPYKSREEQDLYYNFQSKIDGEFFKNLSEMKSNSFIEKYQNKIISKNNLDYTISFKELCEDIYLLKN